MVKVAKLYGSKNFKIICSLKPNLSYIFLIKKAWIPRGGLNFIPSKGNGQRKLWLTSRTRFSGSSRNPYSGRNYYCRNKSSSPSNLAIGALKTQRRRQMQGTHSKQRRCKVQKSGGASSNVAGIIPPTWLE